MRETIFVVLLLASMEIGKMKSYFKYTLRTSVPIVLLVLSLSFSQSGLKKVTLDDSTSVTYHVKNGRLSGGYSSVYSNGQEKAIGTLLNNQRIGEWSVYDSTGNLTMKRKYESPFIFQNLIPAIPTSGASPMLSQPVYYPTKNESGFIEYFYLHERTIVWSRRVWRTISPAHNASLFEDNRFFECLKMLINSTQIKAYHPKNDEFTDILNSNQIHWNNLTLVKYKIKEETFYDNERLIAETRIIGICPVVKTMADTFDLCWVYFPELRPYLAQATLPNNQNQLKTLDDLFFYRDFASSIYKVSNPYDLEIKDYAENHSQESLKQELNLLELEHDVWINGTE